jgi:hypothetical protein
VDRVGLGVGDYLPLNFPATITYPRYPLAPVMPQIIRNINRIAVLALIPLNDLSDENISLAINNAIKLELVKMN